MTLVDALIVFLLIGALIRGAELGFVHQLFSTVGFFVGLLCGAALVPHTVGYAHSPISRFVVTIATTMGLAIIVMIIGEIAGVAIKHRLQWQHVLNRIDNTLGSVLGSISLFITVWLAAAVVVILPFTTAQTAVRGSWIVSTLNRHLPQTPGVIADLGHLVAPNGFPNVFNGLEPTPTPATLPTPESLVAAVNADRASVVKIQGQGCGGIVSGSGFVVTGNLVATNAHVVAGIHSPRVIDGNGTHDATTVWFDPDLDFALLRVSNLAGKPLAFDASHVGHGAQGGVLGYPGGGPFTANTAAVLDEFIAEGKNIYNQGDTTRDIYSVQAEVVPGNSGGPLINTSGEVMGVVFATSTEYNDVGYALANKAVLHEIGQARASSHAVSTGACAE